MRENMLDSVDEIADQNAAAVVARSRLVPPDVRSTPDKEPDCASGSASPDHVPLRLHDGADLIDDVILRALDRLDARRSRVRDPKTGRWTLANGGRLETGLHAESFWTDLEPARALIMQGVRVQLGLDEEFDGRAVLAGVIGGYAEAQLIRRSEFLQLARLEEVPTSAPKQRRRQHERRRVHLTNWSMAFDRELRSALAIGLEKKARPVSINDWRRPEQEDR